MDERHAVERWFLRQGLPHLIHEYRASTDVFTRAVPFLVLVFLFNVFGAFGDRFTGWSQAGVAVLSALLILGIAVAINLLRGRQAFQLPDDVGPIELATFVIAPTVPALLFGGEPLVGAAGIVVLNLVVLGLVYVIVGYGLVPTTVWALRQTYRHLSQVLTLMGRALPFVLVFSAFLFLNAELWQVARDFTGLSFAVTVGLLLAVAAAFIALRIPREIAEIARFESWDRVCALAGTAGSPLSPPQPETMTGRCDPPLTRADRFNVGLVVLFNMGLQIVLVSVAIGLFYVAFGLFAVRSDTIVLWTSLSELGPDDVVARGTLWGTELVLTDELLQVVGFLSAFSALQFAVAAVTDGAYRQEFFDEVTAEVRQALAVRSVYLERLTADAPGETIGGTTADGAMP
ncbi:MAG: hypothetical protein AAGA93_16085 [Actinomycetota bacterium]